MPPSVMERPGVTSVCGVSFLLWLTCSGISSLHIDVYVFEDWTNETIYLRNIMENEIASWSYTVPTSIALHVISENVTIDKSLLGPKKDGHWQVAVDLRDRLDLVSCIAAMSNNIPYITMSSHTSSDCQPITFRPTITNFLQAILHTYEKGGFVSEEILLLLDSSYEMDSDVFDTKNKSVGQISIYNINDLLRDEKARRLLIDLRRVIVLGRVTAIQHFFKEIEQIARELNNEWILIPMDSNTCPEDLNMTYTCIHHHSGIVSKAMEKETHLMDVLSSIEAAINASQHLNVTTNVTYMGDLSWYLSLSEGHQPTITISKHVSFNETILIGEVNNGQITLNGDPEDLFEPSPPPVLKIVIIHEPPFVERVIHENGTRTYQGYSIDILEELAKMTGFLYNMYEVPDNEYGVIRENGSWTGVIGEVATGIADMGVGPISVTLEREAVIDFTAPYYDYAGLQILLKDPREPLPLFVFVTAFTSLAWGIWIVLLAATVVMIYVFHRITYRDNWANIPEAEKFTLPNSVWFVTMSVAIAGPEQHLSMPSTRLVVAGFWLFCTIMMHTYTANLAAFLTTTRMVTAVESLDDLVTQSEYRYTVQKGTVGETYFHRMAKIERGFYDYWKEVSFSDEESALTNFAVWDYPLENKYTRLWESMQRTGFISNAEEGMSKIMEGNFVLFHETPMIKFEMNRRCGLLTVGSIFSAKPYAFVLPQNSPHIKEISGAILELQSTTLLAKLKEKWWESNNATCPNLDDESEGLSLHALGGIFIVTAGGCVLSLIILGIELISVRCRNTPTTSGDGKVVDEHSFPEETTADRSTEQSRDLPDDKDGAYIYT